MDILQQIHTACTQHTAKTGEQPDAVYLGLHLWAQFDTHPTIVTARIYSVPVAPRPMRYICEYEGMTIFRVLDDPEHFRVVGK